MKQSSDQHPIQGSIPDMTSNTQHYVELQQIYRAKADEDRARFKSLVDEIYQQMDPMQTLSPSMRVTEEELTLFCKNVPNLRRITTRSIADEYQGVYASDEEREEVLGSILTATFDPYEDKNQTPLIWYILLRACDLFYNQFGQYPGYHFEGMELENEIKALEKAVLQIIEMLSLGENEFILSTLLCKVGDDLTVNSSFLREIIRFDNAEMHSVASLIGGVASQEVVKLITKQFVPIDGTYVFNGVAGVADVYKI
jgi:amyloid beta precursor protein binding protein 1